MGTKGKRMADNEPKGMRDKRNKIENNTKKKVKKEKKHSKARTIAIIIISILLIFAIIFGVLLYIASSTLGKIGFESLDESQLGLNNDLYNEVSNNVSQSEFNSIKNIALFGIDSGRSDTIIIASINQTDHTIKLISIPRDTYVSVEGHGKTKINHAYAYGKETLALKTINENFGLNISEYVTINFKGLINIINKIGGIELEITKAEMEYINQNVADSYRLSGKSNVKKLSSYGKVTLNGEQALTHARNRTIGNDFYREERQRDVITAVMNKVSSMGLTQILGLSDSILSEVKTNLNITECIGILTEALGNSSDYLNSVESKQIPSEEAGNGSGKGQMISGVYYFVSDLDEASQAFKDTIYGKE